MDLILDINAQVYPMDLGMLDFCFKPFFAGH